MSWVDADRNTGAGRSNWKYTNINSNTTTAVVLKKATLHAITINKAGAASNTITVYDNTSGTSNVLAVIDGTSAPTTLLYDAQMTSGIRVVTATGTAADITVMWAE